MCLWACSSMMHCSDAIGKHMMLQQKAHKGDHPLFAVCLCGKTLPSEVLETAHTNLPVVLVQVLSAQECAEQKMGCFLAGVRRSRQ